MGSERSRSESAHFDVLASRYGNHWWGNETAAGQQREDDRFLMAAENFDFCPTSKVLELGCATGDFTKRLATTGAPIVAIDISPGMVGLARKRHDARKNVRFCLADGSQLGFGDSSFDLVVGNAVLHHLPLEQTLPEIQRVLKPGGKVIFAEPNLLNPQVWLEKRVSWIGERLQNSPDETAFIRWQLREDLKRAGLLSIEVRPFDFLHPATPRFLIPTVQAVGGFLERVPGVKEIAGSLLVVAEKPMPEEQRRRSQA